MEAKVEKSSISKLQEICQQWKIPIPVYKEAAGSYQDFGCEVTINIEGPIGFHAMGRTKKASKSAVADKALAYIAKNHPNLLEPPPLPELDPGAFSGPIMKKTQLNKQKENLFDPNELAKETEQLGHAHVGLDMGRLIQQNRLRLKLTQKDLAGRINEKVQVIAEYENGKALPNMQVIGKLERVLGVHLTGSRSGQLKR